MRLSSLIESRSSDTAPLSFAQRRIWFLSQIEDAAPAYNMPVQLRVRGSLDTAALDTALAGVVRRHRVLRSRIVRDGEQLLQVTQPPLSSVLQVVDLRGARDPEQEVRAIARAEAGQVFDLEAGSSHRFVLARVADEDWVLLLTLSHLVADGWSVGVLLHEVSVGYAAARRGVAAELPELALQYGEFAAWQRDHLGRVTLQEELDYWRRQLADLPVLRLPSDHPRPERQTFVGRQLRFRIDAELAGAVRRLAGECRATFGMTLLAAFQALLSRWSGQLDFAVGTPVANRQPPETEPLIGLFLNNLVLRADLRGEPSFAEVVRRTAATMVVAMEHQQLPFEELVAALRPPRDLGRSPLFDVMFNFLSEPHVDAQLAGVAVEEFGFEGFTAKLDLTLGLRPREDGIEGVVEYNSDLFDEATVEAMRDEYLAVLRAVTADPEIALARLPVRGVAAALPTPAPAEVAAPAPPRGPIQRFLAKLWCEVLELDEVSVHDNFFDLGGHSLLAMRVAVRIEERLGVRVQPMELLVNTLEQMARRCSVPASAPASAQPTVAVEAAPVAVAAATGAAMVDGEIRETAVSFGPAGSVVGVLAEPADEELRRGVGVTLLNAGATPRLGPQRLSVKIARRLARLGYCSLRFDYSGIGDSPSQRDGLSYQERGVQEVRQAFDFLAEARGVPAFVPMGMCWGADNSMRTALADPRVAGALLFDFYARPSARYLTRLYARRLLSPHSWRNFVGGKSSVLRYLVEAVQHRTRGDRVDVEDPFAVPEPTEADFATLVERGVRLCLVYANGAPSYDHYRYRFRPWLERHPQSIQVRLLPNADHLVTLLANQDAFVEIIATWMQDQAAADPRF